MKFYNNLLKVSVKSLLLRKCSTKNTSTKSKWNSVVGLEVHAQIATKSKLFSSASTEFLNPVNTNVSLFDAAIPGTLPVLNRRCVEAGVLTALALSCRVNAVSTFDRKHYFYADQPAGYQITQQRNPLANDGLLTFQVFTPGVHKCPYGKQSRIKQLQLEQDSGKSLHDEYEKRSLVDLNRAGVPLMELVFEPDLSDGEEAAALVKELCSVLRRLGTCSCKMEEGALRVDANVSVNGPGQPLGTRTEIKNIGSVRGVASAVKYEIQRQIALLESGVPINNETRAWDGDNKVTVAMRDKEVEQDYRYMPEPNLPPLHLAIGPLTDHTVGYVNVEVLRNKIPELPEESRVKLKEIYGLTKEQAIILVNESTLLNYFENIVKQVPANPKLIANILTNELLTCLNKENLNLEDICLDCNKLVILINLLQSSSINRNTFNKVLLEIIQGSTATPEEIVSKHNWWQITNENELMDLCKNAIVNNPDVVKQYKAGKEKVFNALLGYVAKISEQRANMALATKLLKELINKK